MKKNPRNKWIYMKLIKTIYDCTITVKNSVLEIKMVRTIKDQSSEIFVH